MDTARFDALSRRLGALDTRRGLLRLLAALPLVGALTAIPGSEEAGANNKKNNNNEKKPDCKKKEKRCDDRCIAQDRCCTDQDCGCGGTCDKDNRCLYTAGPNDIVAPLAPCSVVVCNHSTKTFETVFCTDPNANPAMFCCEGKCKFKGEPCCKKGLQPCSGQGRCCGGGGRCTDSGNQCCAAGLKVSEKSCCAASDTRCH